MSLFSKLHDKNIYVVCLWEWDWQIEAQKFLKQLYSRYCTYELHLGMAESQRLQLFEMSFVMSSTCSMYFFLISQILEP